MNAPREISGGVRAADALREAMVEKLRARGDIRTDEVLEAFRSVPRHVFAPGEPLEAVYGIEDVLITKRDEHGRAISSVSAPVIQAMMLEQAEIGQGMRVLEVGSGGANAALIAELVGADGEVTTVDIDAYVVDRARDGLAAAGYPSVKVLLADAEHGVPEHGPYDRIVVTVGAWDITPAWINQLAVGGRLVVPLRMRGLTRSVVFESEDEHLVSLDHQTCGFVPMQGIGAHSERLIRLHGDEVCLRIDEEQAMIDIDGLVNAFAGPKVERWSGVEVGGEEPFDLLDLWVASVAPAFSRIMATDAAIEQALLPKSARFGASAIVGGDSLAFRTTRPIDDRRTRFEFGVYAHGTNATTLADSYVNHIQTWDRTHRAGSAPRIEVHPATALESRLPPGRVIDKKHTRVVISWT